MVRSALDIEYPRLLLATVALCVLVTIVVAAGTSAAAFGVYNAGWDGASGLRAEADAVGAESEIARETTRYTAVPANGTIAVVIAPDEAYGPEATTRLSRFVRDGGTLLVADDFGPHANALLADLGARARIDRRPLRDDRYHYRSPALPIARNAADRPLTQGVDRLTLNHGSAVRPNATQVPGPSRTTALLDTSEFAYLDTNRNEEIDGNETLGRRPVATVEPVGEGRIVVVSDPSVFINAMLDRPDNRAFLRGLLGDHERVLIDYSHVTRLPPLAAAVLAVRDSIALQLLLGCVALGTVGLWARRPWTWPRWLGWLRVLQRPIDRLRARGRSREPPDVEVGPAEIAALLEERHPDWDAERVRRVTRGVIIRRNNHRNDD